MKSSKVFASPSTREGIGMAALEANACGLPVVTVRHKVNAVCDLVTEERGCVRELSEKELAAGILEEMDAEKKRRQKLSDSNILPIYDTNRFGRKVYKQVKL